MEAQEELILGSYLGCEKTHEMKSLSSVPPTLCSAPQVVRGGEVAKGFLKDPGAEGALSWFLLFRHLLSFPREKPSCRLEQNLYFHA